MRKSEVITKNPAGALEERAYRLIRSALIGGDFTPDSKLSIRSVCAALSLSPMPVRAALRRLVNERALDAKPSGTAVVPRLSRREFSDLTAMRLQLEPLALTLCAPHLRLSQFQRLDALVEQHEAALLASDPKGVRQADTGFLFELYRCCDSALLLSFIESLWLRRSPMLWEARWALLGSSVGRAPHRHREITTALREGRTQAAGDYLAQEINTAAEFLQEVMTFREE
ncbi:GntR family transcriptional regulator [Sinorhizobium meliloti]|uniref:GntR family transcriptional regulator n=1 Tax=Rhizobium meliloti TaxID=382 RepID=UPI000D1F622A|nr:GntR family transcriptional regulator [Sinorhizobium meliloti]RMI14847.1 GntR family transcriptional regulator [Sinorhizobium meliloti]